MSSAEIDFSNFGGPIYSGRDRGELARKESDVDELERTNQTIQVKIDSSTYAVTSSFFLGLFGPSIKSSGSKERFLKKFNFSMDDAFQPMLHSCIERALRGNAGLIDK